MAEPSSAKSLPEEDESRRQLVTGLLKLGLAARHQAWASGEAHGLTPTQGQILALLRAKPAGLRLGDVAEALAVTPPTASVAVRTLVTKGLVAKSPAGDDRRAVRLMLTDAGHRQAAVAMTWSDFLLSATDVLSPAEQAAFQRALVKMVRTLQERGEIPVSRMCVTCRFFRPNAHPGTDTPHHCAYVDAPFGDRALRLECADFEAADETAAQVAWERFAQS